MGYGPIDFIPFTLVERHSSVLIPRNLASSFVFRTRDIQFVLFCDYLHLKWTLKIYTNMFRNIMASLPEPKISHLAPPLQTLLDTLMKSSKLSPKTPISD